MTTSMKNLVIGNSCIILNVSKDTRQVFDGTNHTLSYNLIMGCTDNPPDCCYGYLFCLLTEITRDSRIQAALDHLRREHDVSCIVKNGTQFVIRNDIPGTELKREVVYLKNQIGIIIEVVKDLPEGRFLRSSFGVYIQVDLITIR